MSAPVRIFICLCLLVAARVVVAAEVQRYSSHALLTPAADPRFSVRARLVANDVGAAGRYQLSGRLSSDAQAGAVSAVCVDDIYRNGFE